MRIPFLQRRTAPDPAADPGVSLRDWKQTMESAASRQLLRSEFYRASLILITAMVLMLVAVTLFVIGSDESPNL